MKSKTSRQITGIVALIMLIIAVGGFIGLSRVPKDLRLYYGGALGLLWLNLLFILYFTQRNKRR